MSDHMLTLEERLAGEVVGVCSCGRWDAVAYRATTIPAMASLHASFDQHVAEATDNTRLDGATTWGTPNTWPADAGEFAARWNARTPDQRLAWMNHMIRDAQAADEYDRKMLALLNENQQLREALAQQTS